MRKSITVSGFSHGSNPIPAGSLIGNQLMTGALFGTDPATGKIAMTPEEECRHMFVHASRILMAAGGSFADVLKMTFYLRPGASRDIINVEWVKAFPDEASRPARHVVVSSTIPSSMTMQCDLTAVIGATK